MLVNFSLNHDDPLISHVVLLGDSIFDSAVYVPGGASVIEHLRKCLPAGWKATLIALDGAGISSVFRQVERVPADATHLVLSVGGNNALQYGGTILNEPARSVSEALAVLADFREEFRQEYRELLAALRELRKPAAVCTVYDAIPGLESGDRAGLALFNEVILREAVAAALPVIDLRIICNEASDFAPISPIEPSAAGGGKIARAIGRVVTEFDFVAKIAAFSYDRAFEPA